MKKNLLAASLCLVTATLLVDCSGTPSTMTPSDPRSGEPGRMAEGGTSAQQRGGSTDPAAMRSVYFDYESSTIQQGDAPMLVALGKYLVAHPGASVRVEGNTDERGTREYNVALGERRANVVASALENEGVPARQLSIVSWGEEHPVGLGHDEDSWVQNRRDDLVQ